MGCFINYRNGFSLVPILDRPDWFVFSLKEENPLIYISSDGIFCKPAYDEYETDGATTPKILQWIPFLSAFRFFLSAVFHDGDYRFHKIRISKDQGNTWILTDITRLESDTMLKCWMQNEPSHPANEHEAKTYYFFVRTFGWINW